MKNVFPFKRSDDYFCLILWLEMQFAVFVVGHLDVLSTVLLHLSMDVHLRTT